ncbi:DUF6012 family protein [Buttiauxella agrestis]
MLIHLTPRYYLKYSDVQVDIIDVTIPELNLVLKQGSDITIRTPFSNKNYKVACRKKGSKAINGIFIETDEDLQDFTVITRWAVNGAISRHTSHYHLSDSDFDAVTEEDFLWNGFFNTPYRARCKEMEEIGIPAKRQSSMITLSGDFNSNDDDNYWVYNEFDGDGIIRVRTEYIKIPTVERERLTVPFSGNNRLPAYEDAFDAKVHPYNLTVIPGELKEFGVYVVPLYEWVMELREQCEGDVLFQILDEIKDKSGFFFSNSNHLASLAKAYSPTYNELEQASMVHINDCLNQPVFHVFIDEADNSQHSDS